MSENYREVAERMRRLMDAKVAEISDTKAERIEAYMAAIMADTERHPDDYRLCVHTEYTATGVTVHHWLEHKSVHREFAALPMED
jgi:hypothetical protein